MRERFESLVESFRDHPWLAGQIALLSLALALIYAVVMFAAVARMSPDYFVTREPSAGSWRDRHPAVRLVWHSVKNAVGLLLLLTGLAMLVLPGQGMLTILVAMTLLDFPGKRRLTLRIVRERHVRQAIDWMRRRAQQPPLVLPDAEDR
jgi:hypothetical protein